MQQEIKDIFTIAASKIRDYGLDAANLLIEGCEKVEVEQELQKYIRCAEDEIDRCQKEAQVVIDDRFNEIGHNMEALENSEFSRNLKSSLSGKFNGLPEGRLAFVVPKSLFMEGNIREMHETSGKQLLCSERRRRCGVVAYRERIAGQCRWIVVDEHDGKVPEVGGRQLVDPGPGVDNDADGIPELAQFL